MSSFTRRWRWRQGAGDGGALPTWSSDNQSAPDSEILDTEEQEALVDSFEYKDKVQNFLWRGIFAALAAAFALFFVHSAHQQTIYPWSMKYHAVFSRTLTSSQIIFAELAEAVISMSIAVGVFSSANWHRHLIQISMVAGLLLSTFWFLNLVRLSEFQWQILWLPFGTPSLAAICLYVDKVLAETAKDIQVLRASMYHFKRS